MAEYKFQTITEETIEWETSRGNKIEMAISLVEELVDRSGLGEYNRKSLIIDTSGSIDGVRQNAFDTEAIRHSVISHRFGNIGITAENYAKLQAAKTRVESNAEWQNRLQAQVRNSEANAEIDAHQAKMTRIMSEQW